MLITVDYCSCYGNLQVGENCNFFEWEDPPTCEYGLRFGKKVLTRLEDLQRQLETMQMNHKERVIELATELQLSNKRQEGLQLVIAGLACRERMWRSVSCVSWVLLVVMVMIYFVNSRGTMYRIGYPCLGHGYGRSIV